MSDFDSLPTDVDGLAAVAARPPTLDVGNEALRRLRPIIESWARGVAQSFKTSAQARKDLADEAFAHIGIQIVQFDPTRGVKFKSWCWRVVFNYFRDRIRHLNCDAVTGPGTVSVHSDPDSGDPNKFREPEFPRDVQSELEAAIDAKSLFGETDMQELRSWKLRDRILLLTVSGLWSKMRDSEWNGWATEIGLDTPFPPPSYAANGPLQSLAHDLGEPFANLHRQYYRKLPLLTKLKYLNDQLG